MANTIQKFKWVYLYVLILVVIRFLLGEFVGITYDSQSPVDSGLLVDYAFLQNHFLFPNINSLVKYMGYSLFLAANKFLGFKYTVSYSIIYIISAISVFLCSLRLTRSRVVSLILFTVTLFLPFAFTSSGTQIYRNGIIPPLVICLFSFCILFYLLLKNKWTKLTILKSLFLIILISLLFVYLYYVKEDGLWLLFAIAVLFVFVIIDFFVYLIKRNISIKKFFVVILMCSLPFIFLALGTHLYKSINKYYFGVYETQTRTEGELGGYCKRVYKIKSEYRTSTYWAPWDAVEKTFEVSPTLNRYPKLKSELHKNLYTGEDDIKIAAAGDYLGWQLRWIMNDIQMWTNEEDVSSLFKAINKEIDEAFNNGTLDVDDKIQLISSAGGYSFKEIFDLFPYTFANLFDNLWTLNYDNGAEDFNISDIESCNRCSQVVNFDIINYRNSTIEFRPYIIMLVDIIFKASSVINCVWLFIFAISLFMFLYLLLNKTNKKNDALLVFLGLLFFLGLSLAFSFATSWYTYWFPSHMALGYTGAIPAFYVLLLMFSFKMILIFLEENDIMVSRYI